MTVEIADIHDFLVAHPPFDRLSSEDSHRIAGQIRVSYARSGQTIIKAGEANESLYLIRKGAVVLGPDPDDFHTKAGEGECFAYPSLLRDGIARNHVRTIEDTLFYLLPQAEFIAICDAYPGIRSYFAMAEADRLRLAVTMHKDDRLTAEQARLLTLKLEDLIVRRRIISATPETPIVDAAKLMANEDVSTLLVVNEAEELQGILTDKDMRRRVVAREHPLSAPISEIMTANPLTCPPSMNALDALLVMTKKRFHHLPVVCGTEGLCGMISANDILGGLSANALYVTQRIAKANSFDDVKQAASALSQSLVTLVESGAHARDIGLFISSIGEAVHARLTELAEAELGPPPIPYCLLVFGSLARQDQTAKSDQDNGFLFDDSYDEALHGAYFEALADKVCDALDQIGYVFCGGGIMAKNPKWRLSLSGWKKVFSDWTGKPEPKALMHASIFFDMRGIHGDISLADDLQKHVVNRAKGNRIFLAHMTGNALSSHVPTGFFRKFVLRKGKADQDKLDLKHDGVVPITELARLYTLSSGRLDVNTFDRLAAAKAAGDLGNADANDLEDALHFIADVRLRHQAKLIRNGKVADNLVAPSELSRFDRDHLKDAFAIVSRSQQAASLAFTGGQF